MELKPIYTCSSCKRELPPEAFYFDKRKQRPDSYCKECRLLVSHKQWMNKAYSQSEKNPRHYIVLTDVEDPVLRMKLILHAQEVVNESIARKKRRIIESSGE